MKSTIVGVLGILLSIAAVGQESTGPVVKTTLLSHVPFDGSARVAVEWPIQGTSWAIEPMVGVRYIDYLNGRDLKFSPDARVSLYKYRVFGKRQKLVRTGLAAQYRLMHSKETQSVCTAYGSTGFFGFPVCLDSYENDYERLQHHMQLGMLYGRRWYWGKVQVDLDVIGGLQLISVERPGYIQGVSSGGWLSLDFDPVPEESGISALPWFVIDWKIGLPF